MLEADTESKFAEAEKELKFKLAETERKSQNYAQSAVSRLSNKQ